MAASYSENLREELRVAAWWLKLLGHDEYRRYAEVDLYRWYKAMELRGPQEIREFFTERSYRIDPGPVLGIVPVAPHPPRVLVEKWLIEFEEERRWWPIPIVVAIGILLCAVFAPLAEQTASMLEHSRLISAARP
jgi:hypothetical protein